MYFSGNTEAGHPMTHLNIKFIFEIFKIIRNSSPYIQLYIYIYDDLKWYITLKEDQKKFYCKRKPKNFYFSP